MKKSKIIIIFYIYFSFLLLAETGIKLDIPQWFLNPPKDNNLIYATGFAKKKSPQLAFVSAGDAARAEISRVISVKVNTLTKQFFESAKVKNKEDIKEFSETFSELVSSNTLYFSIIEKQEAYKMDDMTVAYVLAKLDLNEMKKAIDGTLINVKDKYKELDPAKELEELANEIKEKINKEFKKTSITINEKKLKENLEKTDKKENEKISTGSKPGWIINYPVSKEYYIGVGQANNLEQAKNAAINSLVTQIEVTVKSEINDYVKEVNKVTYEEISQNIKLIVKEDIEDLEVVELWNSPQEGYWAYYRLNILEFKKKQQQRIENAKINGLDFLKKSESEKDPALKIKYSFLGYYLVGKYATRALKVDNNGKEVILVNELISQIQKTINSISIQTVNSNIEIDRLNPQPVEIKYSIKYNDLPLINFPVMFSNNKGELGISKKSITDSNGAVSCILSKANSNEQMQSFFTQLDFNSFVQDAAESEEDLIVFYKRIAKLGVPSKETIVKVNLPSFNFDLKIENDLTFDPKYKLLVEGLASNFKNSIAKKTQAKFSSNREKLTLTMTVSGTITKSSLSGQFFTRLGLIISIIDNETNKEIFSKSTDGMGIKGGSITEEKSLRAAIDKYQTDYNEEFVNSIVDFTAGK